MMLLHVMGIPRFVLLLRLIVAIGVLLNRLTRIGFLVVRDPLFLGSFGRFCSLVKQFLQRVV